MAPDREARASADRVVTLTLGSMRRFRHNGASGGSRCQRLLREETQIRQRSRGKKKAEREGGGLHSARTLRRAKLRIESNASVPVLMCGLAAAADAWTAEAEVVHVSW
ncbi:MAG: hypothetical protein CL799_00045 [Chromatiales bacterium]|jgi:hypothetical protein|nr:hypothetical protein [Chromatiales bacterium]